MIISIHKTGDYQTESYFVGQKGVVSIERFDIFGNMAPWPRLRVIKDNGTKVEMDEHGMTIYEEISQ